jgi:hypothetical protein
VLETTWEEEMAEHLGYDSHDPANRNQGTVWSGTLQPGRARFRDRIGEYWARIGHGSGVITFSSTRFAAHELAAHKALRQIAL